MVDTTMDVVSSVNNEGLADSTMASFVRQYGLALDYYDAK